MRLGRIGLWRPRAAAGRGQAGGHPRMIHEPFRDWLLSFGPAGLVAWLVLMVLAIAVPVIIAVAFYAVWERQLTGWLHVRPGPVYVGCGVHPALAGVFMLLFDEVAEPT